nr:restriction endonuclease subunit S [uncultured Helicobacter sp.]
MPSRAKQIVEKDMILYSCVRPNLKHYGIIKQPLENMVCSTGFATLTIENKEYANADFLYYNLTQEHYINLLHTIASTSTSSYPSITPDDLLDLDLALPPLPIQNNIARILSVLDSKIELNNRINKELENLAKLLYTRYFVEFNFPNEQGKPYKSSGGAMVYNETLKREIPKDWEVLKLSHRLHFERGAEFGTSSYAQSQLTPNYIKFYRVGDMLDSQNSVYIDSSKEDAPLINENDLLVSFDGSVGRVAYGLNGTYSSGIRKITDKHKLISQAGLFCIFNDSYIQYTITQYATGTNIKHAGAAVENLYMPYCESIFLSLQKEIEPIFALMKQTKTESHVLSKYHDFLLPLLMNNQVEALE